METGKNAKKNSMRLFIKSQSPYGTVLEATAEVVEAVTTQFVVLASMIVQVQAVFIMV